MDADRQLAKLGKLAANIDHREGGTRAAQNVAALLAWGANLKAEHGECGGFDVELSDDGYVGAVVCPVHGRFEAPEWVEPDGRS